jgi:hypothetical protein
MPCSNQFINFVPGCAKNIIINAEFDEETEYKARFTYPNGFILTVAALVPDEDGSITISNNGYWHNGTGDVMLQIFEGNKCDPFQFTHCERNYESILLSFVNESINPEQETHTVFCECTESE